MFGRNKKTKNSKEAVKRKPIVIDGFVDLGLSSGILWAKENTKCSNVYNENDMSYFTYDEAIQTVDALEMPTETDFKELYDECTWEWNADKDGMVITGPNGNKIFMPAAGFYNKYNTEVLTANASGYYWSCIAEGKLAYSLNFDIFHEIHTQTPSYHTYGYNIRRVKRPA